VRRFVAFEARCERATERHRLRPDLAVRRGRRLEEERAIAMEREGALHRAAQGRSEEVGGEDFARAHGKRDSRARRGVQRDAQMACDAIDAAELDPTESRLVKRTSCRRFARRCCERE
jgi:hypothetical protein